MGKLCISIFKHVTTYSNICIYMVHINVNQCTESSNQFVCNDTRYFEFSISVTNKIMALLIIKQQKNEITSVVR